MFEDERHSAGARDARHRDAGLVAHVATRLPPEAQREFLVSAVRRPDPPRADEHRVGWCKAWLPLDASGLGALVYLLVGSPPAATAGILLIVLLCVLGSRLWRVARTVGAR